MISIKYALIIASMFSAGCLAAIPITINKSQFGQEWPFTVDSGQVTCEKGLAAIFINNGTKYGLNGVAKSLGYADPTPILRDNPQLKAYPMTDKHGEKTYAKISIAPIIAAAQKQCQKI